MPYFESFGKTGILMYAQRGLVSRFFQPHIRASFIFFFGRLLPTGSRKKKNITRSVTGNQSLPAYHRLDLGATYKFKEKKNFKSELSFSLYNAYGRENPYIITFEKSKTDPNKTVAIQTSLFRWIPSISWNFNLK